MIRKNKKLLCITSLLTLMPIPLGLLLWNRFPETIAIHFGITGQPDGFASVPFAVFVPPLIMLALHWLYIGFTALDKGNRDRNQKLLSIVMWTVPLLTNLSCCGIYALALDAQFSPVAWTLIPMGILFAVIGNYMPKTKTNSTIGIKIYWTYTSTENWNATHRFAGKIWMVGGILLALCSLLPDFWAVVAMVVLIVILSIVPIVYSYCYYRKELAQGKELNRGFPARGKKMGKATAVFSILLTVLLVGLLFFGGIDYVFQEDYLLVDTNMYTDYVLSYDTIESVEYRDGNMEGIRVGGFGTFRLLMGFFRNEEFGTYTRYTYFDPEACIVIRTNRNVIVLSGENAESTRTLYEALQTKIGN